MIFTKKIWAHMIREGDCFFYHKYILKTPGNGYQIIRDWGRFKTTLNWSRNSFRESMHLRNLENQLRVFL